MQTYPKRRSVLQWSSVKLQARRIFGSIVSCKMRNDKQSLAELARVKAIALIPITCHGCLQSSCCRFVRPPPLRPASWAESTGRNKFLGEWMTLGTNLLPGVCFQASKFEFVGVARLSWYKAKSVDCLSFPAWSTRLLMQNQSAYNDVIFVLFKSTTIWMPFFLGAYI